MADNKASQQDNPFAAMETAVLDFWDRADIFNKSVNKEAPQGDYVFYDGPPFATGAPHYGHIAANTMKDVVPRYWTMNGYRVARVWGWDCHGLPIENIVEKEMGFKSKKDITNLGVAQFNQACRSKVLFYAQEWYKTIKKLGRWVDTEHAYHTMDLSYMESIWWVFKELWDKGLIYEGYRSMHICPRCETTLSQSEVTEGYQDIKDLSATVKFRLLDEANTYILAWTTTPWTLIGNVALAVGQDIDYVQVKLDQEQYILAKELVAVVLADKAYQIVKELKGKDLVGKKYQPLFPYYADNDQLASRANGWQIYAADFVNTVEGTGVVHIAPAFGEDDMNLGKQHNLPFVQHVNMDGSIKLEATDFVGLNVKPKDNHMATDVEIIKYLAGHGLLFAKAKYEHSYPHCWRCDTPLINYATSSWFVNVTKIKANLLDTAQNINWSPAYMKEGRFGNWLEGARDWSISRQRFWASVIPIWRCDCGELKVFGSVADLQTASGQTITDLHKDAMDLITLPCPKCQGTMQRVPDVLDCWFESGSMPYAQKHYPFANKDKFDSNFPAQFIAEGVDQTRAWFYYLHVIATAIKNSQAFDNVIANGIVLAKDGKKMSKKLQNYPDPNAVIDRYTADALRMYLLSSPVMQAENLNFVEVGVAEHLRKNLMLLWNVYKFYAMYAQPTVVARANSQNILDQWIIARWHQLLAEVTEQMKQYNLPKATRPITEFINDLSTWYVRRSRDRFKEEGTDKEAALATTKYVLDGLAKIIAPFMPFMSENLWQEVNNHHLQNNEASVHLQAWPQTETVDQTALTKMATARKIVEMALAKRDEAKIKVRQPLAKLTVDLTNLDLSADYQQVIADEVNVKVVEILSASQELMVILDTTLTSELQAEGLKREFVRLVNMVRKAADLTIQDKVILYHNAPAEVAKVIEAMQQEIMADTMSSNIVAGSLEQATFSQEVKLNEYKFNLGFKK